MVDKYLAIIVSSRMYQWRIVIWVA